MTPAKGRILATDHDALIALLHDMILQVVPGVQTETKYGGTLYTIRPDEKEGQFCGVFAYTHHVQLSFAEGVSLDDPEGLLSGSGKYRRHVNFKGVREVDRPVIEGLLRQAARASAVQSAGEGR